jgi:DMSO/TMAO reductase YedYZ molybdopterin-dependent catalytic subunit
VDLLDGAGIDAPDDGYFSFHSADGLYFEGLSRAAARDPRTLVVFGLNRHSLPSEYGGPLGLWVPFLQGYKSVKWLQMIRAFRHDPIGIKRLLGHSRSAVLRDDGSNKTEWATPNAAQNPTAALVRRRSSAASSTSSSAL